MCIRDRPITIWSFIGIPEDGTVSRTIYDAIDTQSIIYMEMCIRDRVYA